MCCSEVRIVYGIKKGNGKFWDNLFTEVSEYIQRIWSELIKKLHTGFRFSFAYSLRQAQHYSLDF